MPIANDHNTNLLDYVEPGSVQLIYADMLYQDFNFSWMLPAYEALKPNGSLFVQTDYRSVAQLKIYADDVFNFKSGSGGGYMNNWIIWPYDWGGRASDAYGRKHDDILWYVKSPDFKFYSQRVQIPKATAKSGGLNPSGRDTKIPTDVWSDIGNFLTTDPERIHDPETGKCIAWQKPERLLERIILPCTDPGDLVVDPFLGTGTTWVVCKKYRRKFFGMDVDKRMIEFALHRIKRMKEQIR
jgi:site-specific DNA-methyltransferase (adenine-specific)